MNNKMELTYRQYMKQLVPTLIGHVTNPLIKVIQIGLLGQYANSITVAGLGIGFVIFNTIDWLLSFLRTSIIKGSAVSQIKNDEEASAKVLIQHLVVVFLIGIAFILLKEQLWQAISWFFAPAATVMKQTRAYYDIAICGIVFCLMNYIISGWMFGQGQVQLAAILELGVNVINLIGTCILVQRKKEGITGVAHAFLFSQISVFLIWIGIIIVKYRNILKYILVRSTWNLKIIDFSVFKESDVILRTLCTTIVTNIVIAVSCHMETAILVANVIILQLKDVVAYGYEGISTIIRGHVARNRQQGNIESLKELHRMTLVSVMYLTIGIVIFYNLERHSIIEGITDFQKVQVAFLSYDGWLSIFPVIAGWGLSGYGLYTGFTQLREVKNLYTAALITFFITLLPAVHMLGNHGLWMAFVSFYVVRSLGLLSYEGLLYN